MLAVSSLMIGIATIFVVDKTWYLTIILLARVLQGAAVSAGNTAIISMCTNLYPNHKENMIGLVYSAAGITYFIGPILGAFLFSMGKKAYGSDQGGYAAVFITFTIVYLFMSLSVQSFFPADIDDGTCK